MKLLYSDILPLAAEDGQQTIADCFKEQLTKADRLEIAVGYVSRASLEELDELAAECNIGTICLNIGMYYIEGMPESSYHTAVKIHRKWADSGIGEIRMVRAFKYHGKIYCFYKDSEPFAAIIGSANLGVLKLEASNRRQYELASLTTDADECREIAEFLNKLKQPSCSAKISDISDMPLIFEKTTHYQELNSLQRFRQQMWNSTGAVLHMRHSCSRSRFLQRRNATWMMDGISQNPT